MIKKTWLLFAILALAVNAFSQTSFSYEPKNPKPGDVITLTYTPAGAIAGTLKPIEASVFQLGGTGLSIRNLSAEDLTLKRASKAFTSSFTLDTGASFVYFGFLSGKKFDNNFNEGYFIKLAADGKDRKGANYAQSLFYQFYGTQQGVDRNLEKAIEALEKEMSLYPDDRKSLTAPYYQLLSAAKRPDVAAQVQKEIEKLLKGGLKTEEDYAIIAGLYGIAKLPEQAKMITALKKEKFPQGKWVVNDAMQKFFMEQNPEKKKALLADITAKAGKDEAWKDVKPEELQAEIPAVYFGKKDWTGFKAALAVTAIADKQQLASLYNNAAWQMQETSTDLAWAEEMSRFATEYAKAQWQKPTTTKPVYLTQRQWERNRKGEYAMYADTYAMVLYRMGQAKKGLPYAKDAAFLVNEGANAEYNNTWAQVAENVVAPAVYKAQLETFIKEGKAGNAVKELLKKQYVKMAGSDAGFDDYIVALQKEAHNKMIAELRKSMLNEAAPSFALLDLKGEKIDIKDLKGKTVVVDFWATWCGPCKASFPGMQKMVNKYKENPDVKFVFIDTWERGEDKAKDAGDFVATNKYTFQVLMDNDNKVVEQFKVDGIPTKFVIDKNGTIRFKSVGFNGSDDKLMAELTAMIDMATEASKKTF